MTTVDIDGVRQLLEQGGQLVDVLPRREYDEEHLPGAINIPLQELDAESVRRLDGSRAVIAYCYDYQSDLSPRAACRLAQLGLSDVYDFVAGKAGWAAAGLPLEGSGASERAGDLARRDVPVCAVDDTLRRIPATAAEWGLCVVQDADGCVLGVVPAGKLALGPGTVVADVMDKAPPTLRPSASLGELRIRFARSGASNFVVTTLSGRLVGVLKRADVVEGASPRSGG